MRTSTIDWFVVLVGLFAECKSKLPLPFGYRFRYRHQFGLITLNYAKLLSGMYLGVSRITFNYAYLS